MSSVADQKSSKAQQRGSFALLVKSAVIVSWLDLFSGDKSGTVQVDCRFGDENAVEHMTIWVATERGEWRLAGEYSLTRGKKSSSGMSFDSRYYSEKLSGTLDTILEHQQSFTPLPNPGRDGLIEIEEPTARDRQMAASTIASMLRFLQGD